jgi:D-alanyl-D-alanine carboxypeptidase/D-alanyl-D-alanine-endopeptidase (penicillin-binding protein 4)
MKLLTTTTALDLLGPDHRFETTVKQGSDRRHIVLVGGGDPLLTDRRPSAAEAATEYPPPATLQQLAALTARALKREGVRSVSVGYDGSLFTGPAVNPQWEPGYIPEFVVSPISSLWVDEGRAVPGLSARVADPAREAGVRFAALLSQQGVDVDPGVRPVIAPRHAATLAGVESAPLAEIVQHIIELSDNEGAEVLLRQAALAAGRPGSAAAGVEVVRRTLARLGVDLGDAVIHDGSGLSRHDRLPVPVLIAVLQTDADSEHSDLRPVVTSLPVAGFSGSLDYRFVDAPSGLGLVAAKTGTLTGVHALAGMVSTRSGAVLVFAAVADRVPVPKTFAARAQLDRIGAVLAGCGC